MQTAGAQGMSTLEGLVPQAYLNKQDLLDLDLELPEVVQKLVAEGLVKGPLSNEVHVGYNVARAPQLQQLTLPPEYSISSTRKIIRSHSVFPAHARSSTPSTVCSQTHFHLTI